MRGRKGERGIKVKKERSDKGWRCGPGGRDDLKSWGCRKGGREKEIYKVKGKNASMRKNKRKEINKILISF